MGQIRKLPIILKWIKMIQNDATVKKREFYSNEILYELFLDHTRGLVLLEGFTKIINKIARDEGIPFFRMREKRSKDIKEIYYLILDYSDTDSSDLNLDNTKINGKKRKNAKVAPKTKKIQKVTIDTNPQPCQCHNNNVYIHVEVPVPFPVHVEVPVPVPMHIPMPVHVHVPVYITRETLQQQSPPSTLQPVSTFTKEAKDYIDSVEHLDFQATPRKNHIFPWMDDIQTRDNKTYDDPFYRIMLLTAYELGYKTLHYKHQLILANAILKRESYIYGFSNALIKPTTFHKLWTRYERERRLNPVNAATTLDNKRGENRKIYIESICKMYPSFLHECYRNATKKYGLSDTAGVISQAMNDYAKEKYPNCQIRGNLNMTKHHFWKFFYLNGGKLRRPITKPRLTKIQVQQRLSFANKWIHKFNTNPDTYIAFLDEKWFYTCSRRKKMKLLPKASFESEEDAFIPKPKLRSRRFPCKVMFMGVICPPVEGKTDGKVLLKRVSERVTTKRQSYHQHFVPMYEVNHRLKGGEWRSLYTPEVEDSIQDFLYIIEDTYDLDDDIGRDLVLCYKTLSITKSTGVPKPKLVKLTPQHDMPVLGDRKIKYKNKEGLVRERSLNINDLELRVNTKKGRIIERDITCDSSFMMDHMRDIGKSIRDTYSFLPNDHPIYLFMDNAGGHGKTEIKKQYESILKEEFGIIIEWQVPNSPETNMLDLGVWMALQSLVEKLHFGKVMQSDELTKTVMDAFSRISGDILTRVYERWKLTLKLIVSGKGTNEVVEDYRGKEKPLELPTVPDSECEKGFTYEADLGVEDDASTGDDEEDLARIVGDDRILLEMAFDGT